MSLDIYDLFKGYHAFKYCFFYKYLYISNMDFVFSEFKKKLLASNIRPFLLNLNLSSRLVLSKCSVKLLYCIYWVHQYPSTILIYVAKPGGRCFLAGTYSIPTGVLHVIVICKKIAVLDIAEPYPSHLQLFMQLANAFECQLEPPPSPWKIENRNSHWLIA